MSQAVGITDPLSEITDKNNSRYIGNPIEPLLHTQGTGPSQFPLTADAKTRSVRVYLACAPTSSFKMTIVHRFSGGCAGKFQNFADIPVQPGKLNLKIKIPETTRFTVVVIRTPKNT